MLPRLMLMGTPDFGVPMFKYLLAKGYPIAGVVTQPDRPSGRGHRAQESAVKKMAQLFQLPVLQPEQVNQPSVQEQIKAMSAEVLVVAAFGQILKPELLALFPRGCVNLHGSLLPKYRGAAPIQWAIANGEKQTGVTVQLMASRVDSGPILIQRELVIAQDETAEELYRRMADISGEAMDAALNKLMAGGMAAAIPQDETAASYAPRLKKDDGYLHWSDNAAVIHNRVRGFNPRPGTWTELAGEVLKVLKTKPSQKNVSAEIPGGTILEVDAQRGWLVAAGQGTTIWVMRVQCANTTEMTAQAFTCGYRLGVGGVLGLRRGGTWENGL